MLCPHCGERALAADQRFCHACGARLGTQPDEAPQTNTMLGTRRVAPTWPMPVATSRSPARLLVWAGAVVLALVAVTVVVVAIVGALVAALTALMPLIVLMALIYLGGRRRRRRWRWM